MYTDEELIKEVKILAQKLKRTPKKREFNKYNAACIRFGSWNKFLEVAGLPLLRKRGLSVNDYKEIIDDFVKENGKVPSKKDFDDNPYLPDTRAMERKINKTWSEILVFFGYKPNSIRHDYSDMSDDEVLELIKADIKRIGSSTSKDYFYNRSEGSPSVSYLQNRFGTWTEILKKIDVENEGYAVGRNVKYTKDGIIKILRKIYKEFGRRLSRSEMEQLAKRRKNIPSEKTICKYFQTTKMSEVWNFIEYEIKKPRGIYFENGKFILKVIYNGESFHLGTYKQFDNAKKVMEIAQEKKRNGVFPEWYNAEFPSLRLSLEPEYYQNKFSKELVIEQLIKAYTDKGRRLTTKEIEELSKENLLFPSLSTIFRRFKTKKMTVIWDEIENSIPESLLSPILEKYSKESVIQKLIDIYILKGRRLKIRELTALSRLQNHFPSVATIYKIFGTTKIKEIWQEVEKCIPNDMISENVNYGKYIKNEVMEKLCEAYKLKGGRLTRSELDELSKKNKDFPCAVTIFKLFGTTSTKAIWKEIEANMAADNIKNKNS